MPKKGINALETIFLMFVLIIVVVVVVQMFTRFSVATKKKIGSELQEFEKRTGYEQAVDMCESLCIEYTQNRRSMESLLKFCTQRVSLDINGNDVISSSEPSPTDVGKRNVVLPTRGYVVCEENIYCPQLVSCDELTIKECASRLCTYYTDLYVSEGFAETPDDAASMAADFIRSRFDPGDCDIEGILDQPDLPGNVLPVNWYSVVDSLDCGGSGGPGGPI